MKRMTVLTVALLTSGCANGLLADDSADPGRAQAIERAQQVLHDCLVREARRVDDGRSDAAGVGLTALNACSNERSIDTSARLAGLDRFSREMTTDSVAKAQVDLATAVVLELRRARR